MWGPATDVEMLVGVCPHYHSYFVVLRALVFSAFSGDFAGLLSPLQSFSSFFLGGLLLVHTSFGSTTSGRGAVEGYFCLPSLVQKI